MICVPRPALALSLTAALIACAASAPITAASCAWQGIHESGPAPLDRGDGLVSSVFSQAGYHGAGDWGTFRTTFTACDSNAWVEVEHYALNGDGSYRFNKSAEVERVYADLPQAPADDRLAVLAERAEANDIPLRRGVFEGETCACAAFYPQLRGDKQKYEGTT